MLRMMLVRWKAGSMMLTGMPNGLSSRRSTSEKPSTACLLPTKPAMPGAVVNPPTEATLMMRARDARRSSGRWASVTLTVPR